jgi:hypothetical protein
MEPKEFLSEEFANVKRALQETLRYDYGPDETRIYYVECNDRLDEIERQISKVKPSQIWARLNELTSLSVWISLIERSRLGEFSWPFAESIREIARQLLCERHFRGHMIEPIVHVVAEGEGYQIVYEEVPPPSSKYRFAVVAFPRPLKHHVLLHTIFGHELGHIAQATNAAGNLIVTQVRARLSAFGPLSDVNAITSWIRDAGAPNEIKKALSTYVVDYGNPYLFPEAYMEKWLDELICDLFGLLLFGPGFAAAHQVLLRPTHRTPYEIDLSDPSHPPYAVRHRMLVAAMWLIGWSEPVTQAEHGKFNEAEKRALKYISDDPYTPWASLFDDTQLQSAISGLQNVLAQYGSFGYDQPTPATLEALIEKLTRRLPPTGASIDDRGKPKFQKVSMGHVLFAGWVYWLGRDHLSAEPLTFLNTNKLCDQALLQERAIEISRQVS